MRPATITPSSPICRQRRAGASASKGAALSRCVLRAAAQREFAQQQQRHTDQQHHSQIDEQECTDAVFAGDIGKPPDVAQAYRRAERGHEETCRWRIRTQAGIGV